MFKNAFCLALLVCASLPAQEVRATIGGKVTDSQGGLVPAAAVTLTSDETNVKQTTETNEQGNWSVRFLLPGRYRFSIAKPGFKTSDRSGITLQTGDVKQIDVQLELGAS